MAQAIENNQASSHLAPTEPHWWHLTVARSNSLCDFLRHDCGEPGTFGRGEVLPLLRGQPAGSQLNRDILAAKAGQRRAFQQPWSTLHAQSFAPTRQKIEA